MGLISEVSDDETRLNLNTWLFPDGKVISHPPSGGKKITNLYVNAQGKLAVEYEV